MFWYFISLRLVIWYRITKSIAAKETVSYMFYGNREESFTFSDFSMLMFQVL